MFFDSKIDKKTEVWVFFRRLCGAFNLMQLFWVWILKILISEIWRHEYRRTRYASLWWCRQRTRRQRQRRCSSCLPPSLGLKYIFGKRIPTYVRCIYFGLEKSSFWKTIWEKQARETVFWKPQKDSFISGLLMSAPAAILSILLVFSSPYFHATLITCSLRYSTVFINTVWFKLHATDSIFRATEEYQHAQNADFRSYRYDYSFFDYNFIQGYCYANMYDYEVNQTSGYVDKGIGFSSIYVESPVSQGPDDIVEIIIPVTTTIRVRILLIAIIFFFESFPIFLNYFALDSSYF